MDPEIITKSARSLAASKRWEKGRSMKKEEVNVNWFKSHKDLMTTIISLVSSLIIATWVLSEKINTSHKELSKEIYSCREDLSKEIYQVRNDLKDDIANLNSEIIKIQTVLIIKGVAPAELFSADYVGKDIACNLSEEK